MDKHGRILDLDGNKQTISIIEKQIEKEELRNLRIKLDEEYQKV